jgi:putative nucleotidyltransferase with HDIG domain
VHGLAAAVIAEEIDRQLARSAGEGLYLAALLHDVGKIVLSTVEPESYPSILDRAWAGEGRLDALETATFGVGHAEAGTQFARQCGLPAEVAAATEFHARPLEAPEHRLTVAVVSLANYLAKAYGLGFSGARVEEADGEFENQPGWTVVAEETGSVPDPAAVAAAVQVAVASLRSELAGVRRAA